MAKKNVLGRGLGALIADAAEEPVTREIVVSAIQELNLADIRPNPFQPRTEFDEEALSELAASIKAIGIVQPITVRAVEEGKYEIIAGERRFRASKLAGLSTIPAYIRKTEDDSLLELALIENIQREDLNAIEVAISYQRLIDECNLTQDGLSERVGKKRATIANYLRLLKLPAQIQLAVRDKKISMGHARAILGVEDPDTQLMIFEQILECGKWKRSSGNWYILRWKNLQRLRSLKINRRRVTRSEIISSCKNICHGVSIPRWN